MSAGGTAFARRAGRIRAAGPIAALALVAIALLLAIVGGRGDGDAGITERPAQLVQAADLGALADEVGHRIYWAGQRPPLRLELSVDAGSNVYLRYLTPGVKAGDERQSFLTVGSYPMPDPEANLRHLAAKAGTSVERLDGGAVVLPNPASAGSVYLAYPDSALEIEVYDPDPDRALRLVRAGLIVPAGN